MSFTGEPNGRANCAACQQPFTDAEWDAQHWEQETCAPVHERCCTVGSCRDVSHAEGIRPDLDRLQRQVGEWTAARWENEDIRGRGLILTEEISELDEALRMDEALRVLHRSNGAIMRAILKRGQGERGTIEQWSAAIRKECSDVHCVLLDIAHREGFSLLDATTERAAEVQGRDPNHDPIGGHTYRPSLPIGPGIPCDTVPCTECGAVLGSNPLCINLGI